MADSKQALIAFCPGEDRTELANLVLGSGLEPILSPSVIEATKILTHRPMALVFCEVNLPDGSFQDILLAAKATVPRIPVVVICRAGDCDLYMKVLKAGAFDYIAFPYRHTEVEWIISKALERCSLAASAGGPC